MNEENKPSSLRVKHTKAALFREILPDGFLATQVSDSNGYYVKVLALKNDVNVIGETLLGKWDGERLVQFEEDVSIEQEPVRVQEISLRLTPRMAVNLHNALARELDELPDEVKERYGIKRLED